MSILSKLVSFVPGVGPIASAGMDAFSGLSSVLGGAAKGSAETSTAQAPSKLAFDKLNIDTPATKARRALSVALAQNYKPSTVNWNGPGSGLKGQLPTFSGGVDSALPAAMSDPLVAELMGNVKAGKDATYKSGMESSPLDKVLGAGGLITGILGALTKKRSSGGGLPGQLPGF